MLEPIMKRSRFKFFIYRQRAPAPKINQIALLVTNWKQMHAIGIKQIP
jgi:hypothetical protein